MIFNNHKLEKPKNSYARCIKIFYNDKYIDMVHVLKKHPYFYKFQTRLSDILNKNIGLKIQKVKIDYYDKDMNRHFYYFKYRCLNTNDELIEIYNKLNR